MENDVKDSADEVLRELRSCKVRNDYTSQGMNDGELTPVEKMSGTKVVAVADNGVVNLIGVPEGTEAPAWFWMTGPRVSYSQGACIEWEELKKAVKTIEEAVERALPNVPRSARNLAAGLAAYHAMGDCDRFFDAAAFHRAILHLSPFVFVSSDSYDPGRTDAYDENGQRYELWLRVDHPFEIECVVLGRSRDTSDGDRGDAAPNDRPCTEADRG